MIIPIGDRILVEPLEVAEMTDGGLYIPDSARTTPDKGTVIRVGEDVSEEKLQAGTIVLFRKDVGSSVKEAGKEFILLPIKEVIGIIKEN